MAKAHYPVLQVHQDQMVLMGPQEIMAKAHYQVQLVVQDQTVLQVLQEIVV